MCSFHLEPEKSYVTFDGAVLDILELGTGAGGPQANVFERMEGLCGALA